MSIATLCFRGDVFARLAVVSRDVEQRGSGDYGLSSALWDASAVFLLGAEIEPYLILIAIIARWAGLFRVWELPALVNAPSFTAILGAGRAVLAGRDCRLCA